MLALHDPVPDLMLANPEGEWTWYIREGLIPPGLTAQDILNALAVWLYPVTAGLGDKPVLWSWRRLHEQTEYVYGARDRAGGE